MTSELEQLRLYASDNERLVAENERLTAQLDGWVRICTDLNELVGGFLSSMPSELQQLPQAARAAEVNEQIRDLLRARGGQ